jgi:hypothetical protein
MPTTGLEVRLREGRERAEVNRFTATLNEIVRSLREIDRVYLLQATRATWVLADLAHDADDLVVRLEARLVPTTRELDDMLVPVRALVDGARMLQQEPAVPRLFSPATVSRLARLATPREGIQSVALSAYNGHVEQAIELTDAIKVNADAAVRPFETAYGSVMGTLSGLRKTRGKTLRITVREPINRQAIDGMVPETMAEELRDAWLHRVLLGGEIRRNSRGQAIRIEVDRVERLPEGDSGRPSPEDVLGVATSWLGEFTAEDLIAEVRRADA